MKDGIVNLRLREQYCMMSDDILKNSAEEWFLKLVAKYMILMNGNVYLFKFVEF